MAQLRFQSARATQINPQTASDRRGTTISASTRLGEGEGGRGDGGEAGDVCGASQEAAEQTRSDAVSLSICPSNPGETRPDTYFGDLLVP